MSGRNQYKKFTPYVSIRDQVHSSPQIEEMVSKASHRTSGPRPVGGEIPKSLEEKVPKDIQKHREVNSIAQIVGKLWGRIDLKKTTPA